MKAQHWIFSVRYRTENGRSLQRSAVVGPARASTVETALRLAGLLDDVCAEIRADATVRRFVEGLLDPDASGYHAPSPLTTASEWIVCIGSVHAVIREDPAIAPTKKSLLDWGTDGLYDDVRATHLHGICHAASDGECSWRECPQRKSYASHCVLDKRARDEH